jgi:hypothetical protein
MEETEVKYIMLFTVDGDFSGTPEDRHALDHKVGEWWQKYSESGAIQGGEQLQPARTATTVRTRDGSVTDGPFLESKESIGGFALIDVPDLDAAIAMARTWPASPSVEIRPLVENPGSM